MMSFIEVLDHMARNPDRDLDQCGEWYRKRTHVRIPSRGTTHQFVGRHYAAGIWTRWHAKRRYLIDGVELESWAQAKHHAKVSFDARRFEDRELGKTAFFDVDGNEVGQIEEVES